MYDAMRVGWWLLMAALMVAGSARAARAGQLGELVSPGPLARAHAALEGVKNCASCHEAGRRVTVAKCLTCHAPIADRIARKVGVHRSAGTDCVACHVEHAGRDAELRQFDMRTFNHSADTSFPLDGMHASLARSCAMCHKQRSFLTLKANCSSCHTDVHKGALGPNCTGCHTTAVPFAKTSGVFDHSRTRFPLTGSHKQVMCVQCHTTGQQFRGLAFESCSSCHMSPHRSTSFPATCTNCHTPDSWSTRMVAHDKTRFPLAGAHAQVACEKCHVSGDMARPIKFDQCSTCHANVHGDSIKGDCRSCHTETSFHVTGPTGAAAKFDHATRTGFALEGKHAALECRKCHTSISASAVPLARKNVDFRGARTACVSCHMDPHKSENGLRCEACHRPATFDVKTFRHPNHPEFYAGEHAAVACVKCHVPEGRLRPVRTGQAIVSFSPVGPSTTCRTCHSDVHLGQLGTSCETCHDVKGARFAPVLFAHQQTPFPLTGRHGMLDCIKCHTSETSDFPAGHGTATRFAPMSSTCSMCHKDPHLGQMGATCETCHTTTTFSLPNYVHKGMDDFFVGVHAGLACQSCHKRETGSFPAGPGITVRYRVGRTCAACHKGF